MQNRNQNQKSKTQNQTQKRRRVGAVLFSECSEGTLIISGVVENKIPHMCVTDGADDMHDVQPDNNESLSANVE